MHPLPSLFICIKCALQVHFNALVMPSLCLKNDTESCFRVLFSQIFWALPQTPLLGAQNAPEPQFYRSAAGTTALFRTALQNSYMRPCDSTKNLNFSPFCSLDHFNPFIQTADQLLMLTEVPADFTNQFLILDITHWGSPRPFWWPI